MGMDVTGDNGNYFRANCWSWRPIMEAMWESGACYCMDEEQFDGMHINDGCGAETEEQCKAMAAKLSQWVETIEWNKDNYWVPEVFEKDKGCVTTTDGKFIKYEEAQEQGIKTMSPYRVYKEHLEEWIQFLKDCGEGFEVW